MPLIAIACPRHMDDYKAALDSTRAEPLVVDGRRDDPADVVRRVDGLMLLGGSDVDPALYGEAAHATYEPAEAGRDAFEIELVRCAVEADLPLLAICRGIQVLNVALGGSLVQDIPSQVGSAVRHTLRTRRDGIAHSVDVVEDSALKRILADRVRPDGTCDVNSRHHQAVGRIASGLVVSATASDGVIEAVERPASRFCVGVQWHPENFWRSGEFRALFASFIEFST
jgi:putative glutamine amidotransferase